MPKGALIVGGPDLGAVGNAASVSKGGDMPQELQSFLVKKGDNGGVIVCESYEQKAPAGRRANSFVLGGDYKENPFSPDDGAAVQSHIAGLLSQMGVAAPEPMAPPEDLGPPPMAAAAVRGPNAGAGAVRTSGGGPGGEFY